MVKIIFLENLKRIYTIIGATEYGFIKDTKIKTIKNLASYTFTKNEENEDAEKLFKYDKINSKKQFIFIHMAFDGRNLKYKDIAIDSIGYKNNGRFKNDKKTINNIYNNTNIPTRSYDVKGKTRNKLLYKRKVDVVD